MDGGILGQVLRGSVKTAEAGRRALHDSRENLRALPKRCGINTRTVAKWKKRFLGGQNSVGDDDDQGYERTVLTEAP